MSATDPADGPGLLQAEPADLSQAAKDLRRHLVDAVKQSNRLSLTSPTAVREALRRSLLQPHPDRWTLYALGPDRTTVQVTREEGGTRNLTVPAHKVPPPEDLPPLPRGGQWLVIWNGPVDVLSIEGVPNRLAKLQKGAAVADVIFYDRSQGRSNAVLFSLKLGRGARGSEQIAFPDPAALAAAQTRRKP